MKKYLCFIAFLLVIGVFGVASSYTWLFVTSIGKSVKVEEISFPEEITMSVGDSQFAPITMSTADGTVDEESLPKICKQYKMVWLSSNPEIAMVNRDGEIIAKNPGEVELMAVSYNTADMKATMNVVVEP